jgi:acid phosphatase class B
MRDPRLAMRVAARFMRAAAKRMRVFDFDDTLVSSKGEVAVTKEHGETIKMDSATFAHYKPGPGDKLDFSAFNNVIKPRKIKKNFNKLRDAIKAGDRTVILTARAKGASSAVSKFLETEGIKGVEVVALGSSDPYDKARWVSDETKKGGYADVEFYDDSKANAKAVADVGAKHHTNIKFISSAVPQPTEADYDGPPLSREFHSDEPVQAVVEVKPEPGHGSDWWKHQTPDFKQNYCREHSRSKYCP